MIWWWISANGKPQHRELSNEIQSSAPGRRQPEEGMVIWLVTGMWDQSSPQILNKNVVFFYFKLKYHIASKDFTNTCTNTGFENSNWMHLSIGQVDCKNHLSKCTIHLSEIYKANATYVKIRNMQSSVGQVLQVFHLSDCHFYSSQTIGRVKFRTLQIFSSGWISRVKSFVKWAQ